MPFLYLFAIVASLGALASAKTRKRARPGARSSKRLDALKSAPARRNGNVPLNGMLTGTNISLSVVPPGCPCTYEK